MPWLPWKKLLVNYVKRSYFVFLIWLEFSLITLQIWKTSLQISWKIWEYSNEICIFPSSSPQLSYHSLLSCNALHYSIHYSIYCTKPHCTALHYIAIHNTVLQYTALHYSIHYSIDYTTLTALNHTALIALHCPFPFYRLRCINCTTAQHSTLLYTWLSHLSSVLFNML